MKFSSILSKEIAILSLTHTRSSHISFYLVFTQLIRLFSSLIETSPMSSRNFPPSFWDSNYVPPTPPTITHPQMSDLYSTDSSLYSTEPWIHNAAHYGTYAAAQAHVYHQNMANMAQYGSQLGLLRLPQQYGGHSSR
jgi:hypothetical protein